jgi:HD domain
MTATRILDAALFAAKAHRGQVDKGGWPYIEHPLRVARIVARDRTDSDAESLVVVALLHDVLEDTRMTLQDINEVVPLDAAEAEALISLTRKEGETYDHYVRRAGGMSISIAVKCADIEDNLDPARLGMLPPGTQDRLRRKYAGALAIPKERPS